MWTMSVSIFACVMVVVHNKLAIYSKMFNYLTLVAFLVFSYGSYFLYMITTDNWYDFKQEYFTFYRMFESPQFYLTVFMCSMCCFVCDLFIECIGQIILTDPRDYLRKHILTQKGLISKEFLEEF